MDIRDILKQSQDNHFLLGLCFGNIKQSEKTDDFYIYSDYKTQTAVLNREISPEDIPIILHNV